MAKRSMFEELKQSLEEMKAHREGKITLKTTEVEMPAPVKMTKTQIAAIRKRHNFSQPVFARVLGTKVGTLKNWEQGRSEPNEQAKLLLKMVENNEAFLEELAAMTVGRAVIVSGKAPAAKAVAKRQAAAAAKKAPAAKKKAAAKSKAAAKKAAPKKKAMVRKAKV